MSDKLEYKGKYLEVFKSSEGYEYIVEPGGVYILPFKVYYNESLHKNSVRFLIRQEYTPHLGMVLRPISGTIDRGEEFNPVITAIRELQEETGYKVSENDVALIKKILFPYICIKKEFYVYLVDLSSYLEPATPTTGDDYFEQLSTNLWVDFFAIEKLITSSTSMEIISMLSLVYFIFKKSLYEMD